MKDSYAWIKGFNYVPSTARNDIECWRDYDPAVIENEMVFAERLGLNCARVFLSFVVYKDDPEKFIGNLKHFVSAAYARGVYTMPVIWDSCGGEKESVIDADLNEWYGNPGFANLGPEFWPEQDKYCTDIIDALSGHPGLLIWDIHNEPLMTKYAVDYSLWSLGNENISNDDKREKEGNVALIWRFVRHFCDFFHEHDKKTPVTVGLEHISYLGNVSDHCDVISFHDYSPTPKLIDDIYKKALGESERLGKPVICTELGCPARANPYDIAIEAAQKNKVGFILWELMIGASFWNDRVGIVYPDGTVRDPSIVSALFGFHRNRGESRKPYVMNTENLIYRVENSINKFLADPYDHAGCLGLLGIICSLFESYEVVAMGPLPSVIIGQIAEDTPENRGKALRLLAGWSEKMLVYKDKRPAWSL